MLLKQQMGQQWNLRGNKEIPRDKWQCKYNHTKSMGCSKSSPKREAHSDTGLPQKIRTISIKQPNLPPGRIRKRWTTKPKVSRRKEIIKITEKIK